MFAALAFLVFCVVCAVLAFTPVAVLMFRFNNPDSMLVLLLTIAGYAMVRALERGETKWVALCFSLAAFNGLVTEHAQPVRILEPACVAKTFPDYFETLFGVVSASVSTIANATLQKRPARLLIQFSPLAASAGCANGRIRTARPTQRD